MALAQADSRKAVASPIAIGDLQGCLSCLESLLDHIGTEGDGAKLWLTGDLINRGPESLETLRWVYRNRDRVVTVLGNHDLHLLAVANGIRKVSKGDTLDEILLAPDRDELLEWLRCQPLAFRQDEWLMVHAGVLPGWSADKVISLSNEFSAVMQGPGWRDFLSNMYGNKPDTWREDLTGTDRLRVIVNAMTRIRFCTADGRMDFKTKEGLGGAPDGFMPWFDVADRATTDVNVIFGHWSTLGFLERPNLLGLDTGCVWGGALTGVRLSDRKKFQYACPQARAPGKD